MLVFLLFMRTPTPTNNMHGKLKNHEIMIICLCGCVGMIILVVVVAWVCYAHERAAQAKKYYDLYYPESIEP
jgi:hypothetical protein